jgi:hypothetical protein
MAPTSAITLLLDASLFFFIRPAAY